MTIQVPETRWRPRAERLVAELAAAGRVGDHWQPVLTATPRHQFVPTFWRLDDFNSPCQLIDPAAYPDHIDTWLDAVYTDQSLVTTWSPSMMGDREVRIVTSSASQPCVVAAMLDHLDLKPGQRVLEIGTGTGYNAALLCAFLGDASRVVTIEIDPALVEQAHRALHATGHEPQVILGDGSSSGTITSQFDRVIATCAVDRIPDTWIDWLTPGGRLVTPSSIGNALLVLTKTSNDQLHGRVDELPVAFMPLRTTPGVDPCEGAGYLIGSGTHRRQFSTPIDPAALHNPDFQFWLATTHPTLRLALAAHPHNGSSIVYTAEHNATIHHAPHSTRWSGEQDEAQLWTAVETSWTRFDDAGQPNRDAIDITARRGGHLDYRPNEARRRLSATPFLVGNPRRHHGATGGPSDGTH